MVTTKDGVRMEVATLVMRGDDDQVVPIGASAMLSSKLVRHAQLKVYKGLPHGMASTHHDVINADLLAFIKS
jgi:non-heme chloroperoxidase